MFVGISSVCNSVTSSLAVLDEVQLMHFNHFSGSMDVQMPSLSWQVF
jgi:hypothetical protein